MLDDFVCIFLNSTYGCYSFAYSADGMKLRVLYTTGIVLHLYR